MKCASDLNCPVPSSSMSTSPIRFSSATPSSRGEPRTRVAPGSIPQIISGHISRMHLGIGQRICAGTLALPCIRLFPAELTDEPDGCSVKRHLRVDFDASANWGSKVSGDIARGAIRLCDRFCEQDRVSVSPVQRKACAGGPEPPNAVGKLKVTPATKSSTSVRRGDNVESWCRCCGSRRRSAGKCGTEPSPPLTNPTSDPRESLPDDRPDDHANRAHPSS